MTRTATFYEAWSGTTAYLVGDITTESGVAYLCISAHTNHVPPNGTYWIALAGGSGAVSSVFTRTGAVVAAAGDYYGVVPAAATGATAASQYVGATASGAPASGAHVKGDFVVDQTGSFWVCTVNGTPGTWVQVVAGASGPSFATPAIALGTAAAAGAASTVIRSDSTIVAFDATVPSTQAFGDTAATGSAAVSARRDHKHAMPANPSDATISVSDITTNNASTSAHGFLKKLDNSPSHFMDGQGNWSTPAGTAPGVATDPIWDAKGDLAAGTGADAAIRVAVGANGTVLRADSAATPGVSWGTGELAYVELTSSVTVSATTEASPTDIVSAGAVTYAAIRVRIEFFAPGVNASGSSGDTLFNLWDDTTNLGQIALCQNGSSGGQTVYPVIGVRYLTPTAASHTYKIRAYRIVANGTVNAGAGSGSGTIMPAYIRVSIA